MALTERAPKPPRARAGDSESAQVATTRAPAPNATTPPQGEGADAMAFPNVDRLNDPPPTVAAGCDTGQEPATTRRLWRQIAHRPTSFVAAPSTVHELLSYIGPEVRRVFLTGPRPGAGTAEGFRSWAFGLLPEGWTRGERQHMDTAAAPLLDYVRPDGVHVNVSRAASWFGEGDYSAADAGAAYDATRALIEHRFRGATLLLTPSTTGRELFVHEIPHEREFPCQTDELQGLIRESAGQHRYTPTDDELRARAGDVAQLPGLFEYDARFQYAALAWGLPVGVAQRDTCAEFMGHTRARYRVTFRVPDTWSHLGIFGVKAGRDNWTYPRAPRATGATWADGCEVAIALRHGWHVTIHERIYWATGKPLDKWAAKLVAARESVTGTDRVSGLVRNALRQLLITSIGAFHGTPRAVTHSRPIAEGRPRGEHVERLRAEGDHWVWTERSSGGWESLRHPEWSAAIWARSRCRQLDCPTGAKGVRAGAFNLAPDDVFATRADALYLTRRVEWPDDGKAGRLRLVRAVTEPLPAPRSHAELLHARTGGQ